MKQKKLTQAQIIAKMQVKIEQLESHLQSAIKIALEADLKVENLTKMIFDITKEEEDAE